MSQKSLIPLQSVANRIHVIRGQRVMLDSDLAALYGVPTKALNQAVKRNSERFPVDFMFQLNEVEKNEVVANCVHLSRLRFSPYLPFVFTEHGAVMLATMLNSPLAVRASILVVRAFVKFREILDTHKELGSKFLVLESKVDKHDQEIQLLFETIRQLTEPRRKPLRKIGFKVGK